MMLFLLLTNDTEFPNPKFAGKLMSILKRHKKIGILSPMLKKLGEKKFI